MRPREWVKRLLDAQTELQQVIREEAGQAPFLNSAQMLILAALYLADEDRPVGAAEPIFDFAEA